MIYIHAEHGPTMVQGRYDIPQDHEAGLIFTGLPCGFLHIVLVLEIPHFRKRGTEVD